MFIISANDAATLSFANQETHERAFAWLHTLVDQERKGISAVGFTLKEVYSVLSDRSTPNLLCDPEKLAKRPQTGPAPYRSFVRKAKRLSPIQRAGVALALDDAWSRRDQEQSERICRIFALHGIELRGSN